MTDKLSVADVLDRAATLIEPEGAWTQHVFARDMLGHPVDVSDEYDTPVCFCLYGAIGRVAGVEPEDYRDADVILSQVIETSSPGGVSDWNDARERTQSQVVYKLREAANLARERGL